MAWTMPCYSLTAAPTQVQARDFGLTTSTTESASIPPRPLEPPRRLGDERPQPPACWPVRRLSQNSRAPAFGGSFRCLSARRATTPPVPVPRYSLPAMEGSVIGGVGRSTSSQSDQMDIRSPTLRRPVGAEHQSLRHLPLHHLRCAPTFAFLQHNPSPCVRLGRTLSQPDYLPQPSPLPRRRAELILPSTQGHRTAPHRASLTTLALRVESTTGLQLPV